MPTRILREGIITSIPVNQLSAKSELFYRRLMSVVDDYGRYFSHPSLVRAACYPLQLEQYSEANVKQMLSECESNGLVSVYGGGKYLQVKNFRQQTRSKSKFPEPSENELLIKCKANVNQMRSESESESESESYIVDGGGAVAPDRKKAFMVPTIAEVKLQCAKIGLPESQAELFIAHHETRGWILRGGQKMKSWHGALITWRSNWQNGTFSFNRPQIPPQKPYEPNLG